MIKNRKYVKRGHNWELRQQRQEKTVTSLGFPLLIREKPTAHKQYCFHCRNLIEKGQMQVVMDAGVWVADHYGDNGKRRFSSNLGDIRRLDKDDRLYPRKIYLHTHCFSCLLTKMFDKAGLPLKADCNSCGNKFNCWTNNIDITDMWSDNWYKPGYTPSRPCPVIKERQWDENKIQEVDIWNL